MGQSISSEYNFVELVVFGAFDFILAFFFGLAILGLLSIPLAKVFFILHKVFSREKDISKRYIMLKTNNIMTGGMIIKRGILLYCIAISLTLTTVQVIGFLLPDFLGEPAAEADLETFIANFQSIYTLLVFLFATGITFILPPVWYFDDINLMFFEETEGVKFLYPFGKAVIPALKGFGSISIIISYLVFVLNRVGGVIGGIPITLLFDPFLTLFIPITFMLGFQLVSPLGKRSLAKWLRKQGIEIYQDLELKLSKKVVDDIPSDVET